MGSTVGRLFRAEPVDGRGFPLAVTPGDAVPAAQRFLVTQWLRVVAVALVLLCTLLAPEVLDPEGRGLIPWSVGYALLTAVVQLVVHLRPRGVLRLFGGMLALDGLALVGAMHVTGGLTSLLSFALLLHLVAVSLVASTAIAGTLALWYAFLLVARRAAIGLGLTRSTAVAGHGSMDQRLVVFIVVLGLVVIATSSLSALNERELRRRRGDLEVLTNLAEKIERTADPASVAATLLEVTVTAFGFPRAVVLASAEGNLPLLASLGVDATPRPAHRPGPSAAVAEAHRQRGTVLVRGLDPSAEPWLAHLLPGAQDLLVVPLSTEGRSLGALVVELAERGRPQRRLVSALERSASYAALALRNAWLLEQVQRLAATDGLTKIANRRTFEATLEREVARATRNAEHVSLVMVDIDHFKQLNDSHGHQAGDEVLRNVAAALSCECRDFDTAARYGGEEFAVILPGCGPEEALDIAERLRRSVSAAPSAVPITASAGVATYPSHAGDADTLVRAADEALYASKHAGRNRTTVSVGVPPEAQVDALLRRAVAQRLGRTAPAGPAGPLAPSPLALDN
jgi:two-component system cell cycle response regulator